MISLTPSRRNPIASSATRVTTRCALPPCAVRGIALAACGARLAMLALDVLGERRDFLDRRGEILGATRLLTGGSRCLRGGGPGFLGGGGHLLRALCRFAHGSEDLIGARENLPIRSSDPWAKRQRARSRW